MANHKSARKRAKQNEKRNIVNKMKVSRIRTYTKKLRQAIADADSAKARPLLVTVQSLLSKAAKKSTLHHTAASRKTSRLAQQVNKLS